MPGEKNIVISGASHGLGLKISKHLSQAGDNVVMLAREKTRLEKAASEIKGNGEVLPLVCDISNRESVIKLSGVIEKRFNSIDVLINNAGIPAPLNMADTSFEDWDMAIGTNLTGAFYLTKGLWDTLIRDSGGYVINISGVAGLRGGGSPAYGSSKAGLVGLTRAIAASGVEHNLRATALFPGSMDTGWRGAAIGVKPASESMNPDQVAALIRHLIDSPQEFVINEAVLNPLAQPFC